MSRSPPDKTAARRVLAATFIALGAVLIWLAPQSWPGVALLALGVLVELIGMSISHHRRAGLRNFHDSP